MKEKLIQQVEKESKEKDNYTPFIMVSCHYPLICSEDVTYCRDSLQKMPDLYEQLSQTEKVDFYLGSHMHQY